MYDKTPLATLPLTGAGLFAWNGLTAALLGMAIIGVGIALYRIAPRIGRKKDQ